MTETANPNCFYTIEEKITEDQQNNNLTKTISYIQKTKDTIAKKDYDKLQNWMAHIEKDGQPPKLPVIKTEGVIFNEGILENNIK